MKNLLHTYRTMVIVLSILAGCAHVSAQSFAISPNDTLWVNAPLTSLSIHDIYQVNGTGGPLDLAWDSIMVDLPEPWDYSTCDFGHCYPGIPAAGGAMLPVGVGELGFLGLNLMPNNVPGTGVVQLRVYDVTDAANGVVLTWIVAAGVVGVADMNAEAGFELYPIPAQDELRIRTLLAAGTEVKVYDLGGKAVQVPMQRSADGLMLHVASLQAGAYVLVLNNATGVSRRSFIKQ